MIEDPVFEKHWKDLRDVVVQIETQLTGSDFFKRGVDFLHSCYLTSVGTEVNQDKEKSKQGCPTVTLSPVPLALQNELVEIKALIRNFTKCQSVKCMKDNHCINTTDPKYEGGMDNCEFPMLCIKEAKEEDTRVYKVSARNELGEGECSEELEVIGKSQMIFISGPVVVTPSETITFHAHVPCRRLSNVKWWKIKDQSKKELEVDGMKYCMYQRKEKICFKIYMADKDDSAAYQLSWKSKKSNRIYVNIDDSGMFSTSKRGNQLRLFELQSLSAEAMRIVLDKMPNSFADKIKQYCGSLRNSKQKKDLCLRLKIGHVVSSKDLDISLMYSLIRNLWKEKAPKNGWGRYPGENDIDRADDIERIRQYSNCICHSDASGVDITTFNFTYLDLFRAIERLSLNDPILIQSSCDIMNRVYTNGKDLKKMMEKIENENKLTLAPMNEDPSSPSSFSQDEDIDDNSMPRSSPISTNKEFHCDTQTTEREILFHQVCDSVISLRNNGALATHREDGGVCFTNRPLKVEEEVHIRGIHYYYGTEHHIFTKLGLTNIDPYTIREAVDKKAAIRSALTPVQCCDNPSNKHDHWLEDFHLCISLLPNACLAISLNDGEQRIYDCQIDSTYFPLWLVIELDDMASIWISNV